MVPFAIRRSPLPRLIQALAWLLALSSMGCEHLPTAPAKSPSGRVRGVTLVDWTRDGYSTAASDSSIAALAATGANTLVLVVTAYQTDPFADSLHVGDPRTPSAGAIRHALASASGRGLSVVIKPHVDLDDGTWRGRIAPLHPPEWFASYQRFILPLAALAESLSAPQFVVGTELAGTLGSRELWHETIARVRTVFSRQVVYAASWDEAGLVPFWSDVDRVGIDFYFPVATRSDPDRLDALAGWQPWLARLEILSAQAGRPILLTEIGYRSVAGAGMRPYETSGGRLDLAEQADLYWAALEACGGERWLDGMYWWNWPASGAGGSSNTDYTPRGKPAAAELRASWGGGSVVALRFP